MRLKLLQSANCKHSDTATGVGCTASGEIWSVGDDKLIKRWSLDGEIVSTSTPISIDAYPTTFKFFTVVRGNAASADVSIIGCDDGTFRIINASGRTEKVERAHQGAVLSISWSGDGSSFLTGGEDGVIKHWSRTGHLRSTIVKEEEPIIALSFASDNTGILYTCGAYIHYKPLQAQLTGNGLGPKATAMPKWHANEGAVLSIDWHPITGLIVCGGEDGRYRIFDSIGTCIFTSSPISSIVTCVKWNPSGTHFAVGGFNILMMVNAQGWMVSRIRTTAGSVRACEWSVDGSQLVVAGAVGNITIASLVDRRLTWQQYEAILTENNTVRIVDLHSDGALIEEIDIGTKIMNFQFQYGHLLITTARTCHVYHASNSFTSPHIIEVRYAPSLTLQTEHTLALVDPLLGLTVYTYDGKPIGSPTLPNINPLTLHDGKIDMSMDAIAVIDRMQPRIIHLLEVDSGKKISEPIVHTSDVVAVRLSHAGGLNERKIAFIDSQRDLHIAPLHRHQQPISGYPSSVIKIASLVDSIIWHEKAEMLCCAADGSLHCWYAPQCVYVDGELLPLTKHVSNGLHDSAQHTSALGGAGQAASATLSAISIGRGAQLIRFANEYCTYQRADGAECTHLLSPYPLAIHSMALKKAWVNATHLCQLANEEASWAVLAVLALQAKSLDTAEVALSALDEVVKVYGIQSGRSNIAEGEDALLRMILSQH